MTEQTEAEKKKLFDKKMRLVWKLIVLQCLMIFVGLMWPLEKGTNGALAWEFVYLFVFASVLFLLFRSIGKIKYIKKKHQYDLCGKKDLFEKEAWQESDDLQVHVYKCIHCENVISVPLSLLKFVPEQMAECEMGTKTTWKERFTGLYNCYCGPPDLVDPMEELVKGMIGSAMSGPEFFDDPPDKGLPPRPRPKPRPRGWNPPAENPPPPQPPPPPKK